MQIVIDIPEEEYKNIMNDHGVSPYGMVFHSIQNGTPLPEKHGRLVDADELISNICGSSCGCHIKECGYDNPCYSVARISSAQTIIEADKTESGDDE